MITANINNINITDTLHPLRAELYTECDLYKIYIGCHHLCKFHITQLININSTIIHYSSAQQNQGIHRTV